MIHVGGRGVQIAQSLKHTFIYLLHTWTKVSHIILRVTWSWSVDWQKDKIVLYMYFWWVSYQNTSFSRQKPIFSNIPVVSCPNYQYTSFWGSGFPIYLVRTFQCTPVDYLEGFPIYPLFSKFPIYLLLRVPGNYIIIPLLYRYLCYIICAQCMWWIWWAS